MTNIRMTEVGPTLTSGDVDALERRLACRLPEEYRTFLLENNGGIPSPDEFEQSAVRCFLSVQASAPLDDVEIMTREHRDRIPDRMIVIAKDDFGNLVLLSVSGNDLGAVNFWDHEQEHLGDAAVSPVASSFKEFLLGLR